MDLILDIIGYAFLAASLAGVFYVFFRLLLSGIDTLTKHDD